MLKKCLTIAGSDSSGGAGVQADLKTFSALGTYGMSCICALTAQNTQGVDRVENVSQAMIEGQLLAIYNDIVPDAVKTGMLSCRETVETVAGFLENHNQAPLVVDPVMVATTGARLLDEEAIISYKERLIPLATLVTPNIPEAEVLSGMAIHTEEDMKQAAEKIMRMGPKAVLIKGGHKVHDATDFLYDGETFHVFRGEKIDTENTHGTGCTLSSALAVYLAQGYSMVRAAALAKKYLTGAIRKAAVEKVGHGHGPVSHFWFYGNEWGKMK